jgi:hypothetical protein
MKKNKHVTLGSSCTKDSWKISHSNKEKQATQITKKALQSTVPLKEPAKMVSRTQKHYQNIKNL